MKEFPWDMAFKMYVLEHNTIEESTNVTFYETKFPEVEDDQVKEPLAFEIQSYLEQMELVGDEPTYVQDLSIQPTIDQIN